jgi:hypothetical protein
MLMLASAPLAAQSDQGLASRSWGVGQPQRSSDLPPGQLRRKLESLPPQANAKAMKWLQDISFTGTDLEVLQIDDEGGVFFVDPELPDPTGQEQAPTATTPEAAPQSTLDDAFTLHSKPGAPNVVYIDFNGHTITGTAWNSGSGALATYVAKPYDLDSNPTNFSTEERTRIVAIWHRVAEDLAAFNIDVTTQEPSSFNSKTGRLLVTPNVDANGNNMPYHTAGGVAYVNVFGYSNYHTYYSPALVYSSQLGNSVINIAEAASHEFGHNLGLSHDGLTTPLPNGTGYYTGHGSGLVSWAPIMGVGYYKNVTQWSKGEYTDANQPQDDLAIIQGKLGLKTDDHGNTIGSGTTLLVSGTGVVTSSNPELDPHNVLPENKGIVNLATDVDVFTFAAAAGPISLTVRPAWDAFYNGTSNRGANLDIKAELRNAAGNLLATNDPTSDTMATINYTVSAGTYHLMVSGVGNTISPYSNYASQGMYFINGTVTPASADATAPTPNPMTWASVPAATGENSISMTASAATDETSSVQYRFNCTSGGAGCVTSPWQSGTAYTATGLAAATQYTFTVNAKDLTGNLTTAAVARSATTETPPPPPPPPAFVDHVASSDTVVAGSVNGGFGNSHGDDGVTQSITETESGGKPTKRYSHLEHRWSFTVSSGASATIKANAWSSGSTDGDTFNFQYSLNGGSSWSTAFNVSATANTATQSFLLPGTPSGNILLRVVDTNQSLGALQLNTIFVDHLYIQVSNPPSDPPDGGPSGLSANASSSSQINLIWSDGANNETGFRVDRSPDGSTGWVQVAGLAADSKSWSDMGLGASTTYYYRVRAFNDNGDSAWAYANATTQSPPPPPVAPTGLTASGVSVSQINLSWSHSGTNEDGFRIERRAAGTGTWAELVTLGVNASGYSNTGLPSGTSFDYRVAAFNGSGEAMSGVATGTTDAPPAISLSANGSKDKGAMVISLSWSGASNVDIYRNGSKIATAVSGTTYTDNTGSKGSATWTHQVCVSGSTSDCSNTTTTVF